MFTRFIIHGLRTSSGTKLTKALYSKSQSIHEVKEIEIPVPWGKVAGKLWGSQDKQPILAMHGWQDNAASFDNIAPLIMKHSPVLAIDLPGHGLSSWLPPGFMYSELVYLLWYAAIFPNELQYVVALDLFKFPSLDTSMYATMFGNAVDAFFKMEENKTSVQPSYTQSEIIKKASIGFVQMHKSIHEMIMTRGTTQKEDGTYIINRDPTMRVIPIHSMFSHDQLEEHAKLIKCPYLIIKGEHNFYGDKEEDFYRILEVLKASKDNVYYETLSSTHHPHLTHAKDTAAIIIPFLEKYD